jgi:DNA polymerase-3 subunit delta'
VEIENINRVSRAIYPWQKAAWEQFDLERLPQAILLHGQAGIGKLDFALELAQAVLCEADLFTVGPKPCKECQACRWFETANHPDWIALVPPLYRHKLPHAELEGMPGPEIDEPDDKEEGDSKKESAFIKVEQVRFAIEAINVGTHRGGKRVVLIYPLEGLRTEAANTLLKSLEEPNEQTIFILVSDRLDRVLPTIRSRCQLIALPKPRREEGLQWLQTNLGSLGEQKISAEEIEATLDEQGGAPLAAREIILSRRLDDDKDSMAFASAATRILLEAMSKGKEIPWIDCAEKIHKAPFGILLACMQRWLFDIQSAYQIGELRYYRRHEKHLQTLARQVNPAKLLKLWKTVLLARRHENHPLSTRVQMESLLLQYQQLFED